MFGFCLSTLSPLLRQKRDLVIALQSIQKYKEKVGNDGLLELSFTAEEKFLTDAEANPVRFSIQVSRMVKDPNDFRNNYYIFEEDQLVIMPYSSASLVRSPDMKTIGIKATKQDETPFTKEEKVALRKQLVYFDNTALIVEKGILTPEAIENCTVPVTVDLEMAEIVKGKNCYCNKDLTEEELRALVKTINGSDTIWGGKNCNIDDKSYKSLAFELNTMFRKYNINECIQKIAFLAMTSVETGFFQTTGEIKGDTNSSQYFYSGRGILQLTGDGSRPVIYTDYQNKIGNAYNIIANPNLVSQKLFLAVDSGGFVWNHIKALDWKARRRDSRDKDQITLIYLNVTIARMCNPCQQQFDTIKITKTKYKPIFAGMDCKSRAIGFQIILFEGWLIKIIKQITSEKSGALQISAYFLLGFNNSK